MPRREISVAAPVVAGLATVCASTSLTGVIDGLTWLGYVLVATMLVAFTGVTLRSLRAPTLVVALSQLLILLFLVVGVFTRSGVLGIIPGPTAIAELNDVLVAAFEQVRTGLPPVEPTAPILCLVTISLGLVAVLVDTLAVAAGAPAATGLVLLCVYAVPSALAADLLPWWTFALGAGAFAGLLAVDGAHRHRRWSNRAAPGAGPSPGSASTPITVVTAAIVVGLVAGGTITAVGTEGSLPGSSSGGQNAPGGLGVNPFTSLRGMLDQGANAELFRVRGLGDDRRLLRAFTLSRYEPNAGWRLPDGPMPEGVPADGPLPAAPGDDGSGESRQIRIEPVDWYDLWLPVYGSPRGLRGLAQGWYYDTVSGSVYRERRQRPSPYTEIASLHEPSKEELRAATADADDLPPRYTDDDGIDPRVTSLSRRLTRDETNDFDRAQAIWSYFSAENGFVYDEQTAPANDPDAVADFLLNGKRGFCEQYASSMAVMLRSIGLPSRVAIGFTTGFQNGEYRSITSQDAHAWVEVYFGDLGWVSFDPTPLSDGRGYIPPYLQVEGSGSDPTAGSEDVPEAPTTSQAPADELPEDQAQDNGGQPQRSLQDAPPWAGLGALVAALAALAMTVAAVLLHRRGAFAARSSGASRSASWVAPAAGALWLAALLLLGWQVHWTLAVVLLVVAGAAMLPSLAREYVRRQRVRAVSADRPNATHAAWDELLDECADRGMAVSATDTVRLAAQRIAEQNRLDQRGEQDLRTVVDGVERAWYSPASAGQGGPSGRDTPGTGSGGDFARAFDGVRQSLRRSAPLPWRARLFPRSVLRKRHPNS